MNKYLVNFFSPAVLQQSQSLEKFSIILNGIRADQTVSRESKRNLSFNLIAKVIMGSAASKRVIEQIYWVNQRQTSGKLSK